MTTLIKRCIIYFLIIVIITSNGIIAYANETQDSSFEQRLINSTTYVPIRDFCLKFDDFNVKWDDASKTASFENEHISIKILYNESLIIANGRYIKANMNILLINNRMFVPIRSIAKVFGLDVKWNNKTKKASIGGKVNYIKSGNEFYNQEELYWLSRIINAESSGEPMNGKIAVGNVIINRMKSDNYPNSIKDVIFDDKYGVQFTPAKNKTIYNNPNDDSIKAAKIVLDGYSLSDEIIFFVNRKKSPGSWIENNRMFVMEIGLHTFYK